MVHMDFCDLSPTSHKQHSTISMQECVIYLWELDIFPNGVLESIPMMHLDLTCLFVVGTKISRENRENLITDCLMDIAGSEYLKKILKQK